MTDRDPHLVPAYGSYLRLDLLLAAQEPPDFEALPPEAPPGRKTRERAHHDELLFIIVHQVYELWFKLVLAELERARDVLGRRGPGPRPEVVEERRIPAVVTAVERANVVLVLAIDHFRLIETMPPQNFLAFRDLIIPASGFQSAQFRELEILAGLPEDLRVDFEGVAYASRLTPGEQDRIDRRLGEMTLKDALYDWLSRTPIDDFFPRFAEAFLAAFDRYAGEQARFQEENPNLAPSQKEAARRRAAQQSEEARRYLLGGDDLANRAHQAFLFIATYRDAPLLRWPSRLIDTLVEFEQSFRTFRFRHARMVERMIGFRTGTGGSPGVSYLDHTTRRYRIFGDLLEARSFLLAPDRVPPVPDATRLGFAFEE